MSFVADGDSNPFLVLDTTVLLYAVGSDHTFRAPCQRIVKAVQQGVLRATTTVEVIQEFAHVRAQRRDRKDAAELASAYIDLLTPLLIVEAADLRQGLRLFTQNPTLGSFDCVLAAATQATGGTLVSADKAFSDAPRLHHIVPSSSSIAKLLGQVE